MGFVRNASLLTFNTAIGAGLLVIINSLSARILTPSEFGSVAAAVAAVALLMRIASLGLGASAQFHGARETNEKQHYGYVLGAATCMVVGILLVILTWNPRGLILFAMGGNTEAANVLEMLKWGIPQVFVNFIAALYMLGRKEIRAYLILSVVPLLASLSILILAKLRHQGIEAVILAWRAYYMLSFLVGMYYLLGRGKMIPARFGASLQRVFVYGAQSYVVFIVSFAVTRIAFLIGTWFTTSSEIGHFAAGRTFADSLLLVYGAIGPLVFSHVGGLDHAPDAHRFIGRVGRVSTILYSAVSVLIAALAPIGVSLIFGGQYADSYLVVWLMLPGLVLSALQRTLENYLFGRGKQTWLILSHIVAIGVALLCGSLMAPRWGALGLACGSTMSCIGSFLTTAAIAYRKDGIILSSYVIPQGGDFRFLKKKTLEILSWKIL